MTINEFHDVIDFAVEREKEAVQFYTDLQEIAKFAAQKVMLGELADMERGHIRVLEGIRKQGNTDKAVASVPDLQISDYLVPAKPTAQMTYQDIIITAMKREEKSKALYENIASKIDDAELAATLLRIAAEEAQHKLRFEKIYDEEILKDN